MCRAHKGRPGLAVSTELPWLARGFKSINAWLHSAEPQSAQADTKFRSFQGTILLPHTNHCVLAHPYCPEKIRRGVAIVQKIKKEMKPMATSFFWASICTVTGSSDLSPCCWVTTYLLFSFPVYHISSYTIRTKHSIPSLNSFTFSIQSLVWYRLTVFISESFRTSHLSSSGRSYWALECSGHSPRVLLHLPCHTCRGHERWGPDSRDSWFPAKLSPPGYPLLSLGKGCGGDPSRRTRAWETTAPAPGGLSSRRELLGAAAT